jgi:Zn-dependent protease with chaperone function
VDTAKPYAFALKKDVFITVGMFDILTKKEQEAVLLHELGHVRQKTSLRKFTAAVMRLVSPVSAFYTHKVLNAEERDADAFAASIQGTTRYVLSARAKLNKA